MCLGFRSKTPATSYSERRSSADSVHINSDIAFIPKGDRDVRVPVVSCFRAIEKHCAYIHVTINNAFLSRSIAAAQHRIHAEVSADHSNLFHSFSSMSYCSSLWISSIILQEMMLLFLQCIPHASRPCIAPSISLRRVLEGCQSKATIVNHDGMCIEAVLRGFDPAALRKL